MLRPAGWLHTESPSKWLTSFECPLKTGADCGRNWLGISWGLSEIPEIPELGRVQLPSKSGCAELVADAGRADAGRAESGRAGPEAGRAEDGRTAGCPEDGLEGGLADGADAGLKGLKGLDGLGLPGGLTLADDGRVLAEGGLGGVTRAAFADAGRAWV